MLGDKIAFGRSMKFDAIRFFCRDFPFKYRSSSKSAVYDMNQTLTFKGKTKKMVFNAVSSFY